MEEVKFTFGEQVLVKDEELGDVTLAYFVAKIEGVEYPYIVVFSLEEIDNVRVGDMDEVTTFKYCNKIDPIQKYKNAIENIYFLKEDTPMHILFKLVIARNKIWEVDNWKPDWEDTSTIKYAVECYTGDISETNATYTTRIFSFKSPEIRDWFAKKYEKQLRILVENNLL